MSRLLAGWPPLLFVVLLAGAAHAQQSNEDRLREALRKTLADLRALQDSQALLQARLSDALHQRDALQQLLDQARAQLAQTPAVKPADPAALQAAQDALARAREDAASRRAALAKWQSAYKGAAEIAQAKDAEARRLDVSLKSAGTTLEVCKQANQKLIGTASDILHLYQTVGFRTLVLQSYEPFLGLKRTELENLVQSYEDRISDASLPASRARP
jgi:chromosome segregation ATPase